MVRYKRSARTPHYRVNAAVREAPRSGPPFIGISSVESDWLLPPGMVKLRQIQRDSSPFSHFHYTEGLMRMRSGSDSAREKLITDFRVMMSDTEDLLRATAGQGSDALSTVRSRAESSLRSARAQLDQMQGEAGRQARKAARYASDYVRENPWASAGMLAAIAGIAVGWMLMRRD